MQSFSNTESCSGAVKDKLGDVAWIFIYCNWQFHIAIILHYFFYKSSAAECTTSTWNLNWVWQKLAIENVQMASHDGFTCLLKILLRFKVKALRPRACLYCTYLDIFYRHISHSHVSRVLVTSNWFLQSPSKMEIGYFNTLNSVDTCYHLLIFSTEVFVCCFMYCKCNFVDGGNKKMWKK